MFRRICRISRLVNEVPIITEDRQAREANMLTSLGNRVCWPEDSRMRPPAALPPVSRRSDASSYTSSTPNCVCLLCGICATTPGAHMPQQEWPHKERT